MKIARVINIGVFAFLALVCVFLPRNSYAAAFSVPYQDARAMAIANAYAAVPQGPEGVYYNPAAITSPGFSVRFGSGYLDAQFKFDDTTRVHSTKPIRGPIPSLFASYQINPNWTLAVGGFVPFAGRIEWPTGWPGAEHITSSRTDAYAINVAARYSPFPKIATAIGLAYLRSISTFERTIPFGSENVAMEYGGSANAAGANAGALYVPNEQWHLGVNVRTPVTFEFDGKVDFDTSLALAEQFPDGKAKMDFDVPWQASLGVYYQPIRWIGVYAQVDGEFWSQTDKQGFTFATGKPTKTDFAIRNWKDAGAARLGLRGRGGPVEIALGYALEGRAVPNSTVLPDIIDFRRNLFTGGIGFQWAGQRIDVAAGYGVNKKRTVTNNMFDFNGVYELNAFVAMANIGLTFGGVK